MGTRTESAVSKEILLALNSRPDFRIWRFQSGVFKLIDGRVIRVGFVGAPDFVGFQIKNGLPLFIGVEVKRPGGRLRQGQKEWMAFAASKKIKSIVADSAESALSQLLA